MIKTMKFKWLHSVSTVDVDEETGLINVAYADHTVQTLNQLEYSTLDMKVAWEVVHSDPPVHCTSQVHTIQCQRITDQGWCFISWNTDFSADADLQIVEDCKWKKADAFDQLKDFVAPGSVKVTGGGAAASKARHVLMVFTNHNQLGDTGKQTGWYLPEAAHPYKVFKQAGFRMTFASPRGGAADVDEGSVAASKEDAACMDFHNSSDIQDLVKNTKALADVDPADYDAVFFVGGFGTMWDFPDDANVQRVAAAMWEKGGIVSAVCHGPVALVNVKLSDGSLLVQDKEVTAFTNGEEDAVQCRQVVPYTCEDKFNSIGAKFSDGGVFQANTIVSGRLITGQNPPSADGTAKAVVAALR